jgi:acetylornithine deacetylase/succinyl-diaminopimelate desuccinylase family protein
MSALADDLVAALGELIAIPSTYPPGDTRAICAYAARRLAAAGYAVETVEKTAGVANVVARLGGGRPCLVFNAHVDTVGVGDRAQWRTDPFAAHVADGRVAGLGAGNCKGSMAVQLRLAEEIARRGGPQRGEAVFTFVGDEERLGTDGMKHLRDAGAVRPDMLVLGAQTGLDLIAEERGVMWARLTALGRAAHAGEPAAGDNAIDRLLRLIGALDREIRPRLAGRNDGAKRSTLNLGRIEGGRNANVVPDRAWAEFDRRLLPSERVEAAFAEMRAILAGAGEPEAAWSLELLTGTNGFSAPKDGPCAAAFRAAIEARLGRPARFLNAIGVSDGRWFADDGAEILNFGPGEGAQGHAANESVPIAELEQALLIQLDVVGRVLGLRA